MTPDQIFRNEVLEEAAKFCEEEKLIDQPFGPLFVMGWGMAIEHLAECLRRMKTDEHPEL